MMKRRRVFLGLPLANQNSMLVQTLISSLEPRIQRFRWVAPENYHVTLVFIGEIEESVLARLTALLRDSVSHRAFRAVLSGVGRFPDRGRRVRVLHIPIIEGSDETRLLAESIRLIVSSLDINMKSAGRFTPHMTIGRARGGRPIEIDDATDSLLRSAAIELEEQFVSYALYESVLTPRGAHYKPLSQYPLV